MLKITNSVTQNVKIVHLDIIRTVPLRKCTILENVQNLGKLETCCFLGIIYKFWELGTS